MTKSTTMSSGAGRRVTPRHAAPHSQATARSKFMKTAAFLVLFVGAAIIVAMPEPGANKAMLLDYDVVNPGKSPRLLTANQAKFDFGSISMGAGKVTHRYAITNAGSERVAIRKIYTSCMCTSAALVKGGTASDAYGMPGHGPIPTLDVPMEPGEDGFIEVVFDPAAHGPAGVGPIERTITIETSAGQPVLLAFAANVRP